MFTTIPTYSTFRTLRLTSPHLVGEDVYALQTALGVTADGILGPVTAGAIVVAQRKFGLVVDGLAGGRTQQALALERARIVTDGYALPAGALKGQLEHESSFRLGAYSPLRPDGSYDAGVAQRNTRLTPAKEGFNVPVSVDALGARVRHYFNLFVGVEDERRWDLAQGSWNAPAFASYLAREAGATGPLSVLKPTAIQRTAFEAYITAVTRYR